MATKKHLNELSSLRFFAAFAIVVLHFRDYLGVKNEALMTFLISGQYGVTFFFVLSGFILMYNYESWFGKSTSVNQFWKFQQLRFARLYPVYIFALLLNSFFQVSVRVNNGEFASQEILYWASWLINAFGLQSWVPGAPYTLVWNTPSWSISTELFFYMCFPLICYWLVKYLESFKKLILFLIALLIISSVVYSVVLDQIYYKHSLPSGTSYSIQYFTPILRLPEFIAGCIGGKLFLMKDSETQRFKDLFFGSEIKRNIVIVVSIVWFFGRVYTTGYADNNEAYWLINNSVKFSILLIPFLGIIFALSTGQTFISKLLNMPFLILLGESSYALYITHWSFVSFYSLGFLPTNLQSPFMSIIFMTLSVGFSVIVYKTIEIPMKTKLRGAKTPQPSSV
ncbi:acyltransferase family protein [Psychrobacter sp.]|uniref:acyltransferase family protein n=1 Tax=Psychrobacter sp. TaxID=56811 RepID=UPI003BAE8C87